MKEVLYNTRVDLTCNKPKFRISSGDGGGGGEKRLLLGVLSYKRKA